MKQFISFVIWTKKEGQNFFVLPLKSTLLKHFVRVYVYLSFFI